MRRSIAIAALFILTACGSTGPVFDPTVVTDAPPYVSRIDPTSGSIGDTVTIYGYGFSSEIISNIVSFGDEAAAADSYEFLIPQLAADELEKITVVVPDGLTSGDHDIAVLVFENVSNADVTFTVK